MFNEDARNRPDPKLQEKLEAVYKLCQQASYSSCLEYLNRLVIDCRPDPAPFRERADPWQWALAAKVIPAIESVARTTTDYAGPTSFWLTLPRGHDKTSFVGRLLNWILAFSRINVDAVAAAADKDQANLLVDAMQKESRLNPWLGRLLSFKHYQAKGLLSGSSLEILSSDAPTSYGLRPDIIVCDELTQWGKQDLWDALLSGRRKRGASAVQLVITNAGLIGSWQWQILQLAKKSPKSWWVYEAPGMICSWISRKDLEEDRKQMLPSIARRMLDNQWLDPAEGAGYLTRTEARACEDLGASMQLRQATRGQLGIQYIASIDYGPVKDRTAMCIMHDHQGVAVVDRLDVLQGSKKSRVLIKDVEDWIDDVRSRFDLAAVVVDPYQMESTIQKYEKLLPVVRFEPRGGKANYELAQTLRSAVLNSRLAWAPGMGDLIHNGCRHTLADELAELGVRELSYGYRVMNLPGRHDDRCVAVGMALVSLLKAEQKRQLYEGDYFW